MYERFAVVEEMLKKLLEDKSKTIVPDTRVATGDQRSGGNPNMFRGRENQEVEILEGEDAMPPLEPLSREEMGMGYERRGTDFERKAVPDFLVGGNPNLGVEKLRRRAGTAEKLFLDWFSDGSMEKTSLAKLLGRRRRGSGRLLELIPMKKVNPVIRN
ncbi:hypothetical protein M5K25_013778 [Dendrobium thyrsiflorum]|uniref:Uncharacterized protein n=1 Tax=Dendrobium thyrsiflorum TaxID=117978 RepID=A0ABD0V135_DENTH